MATAEAPASASVPPPPVPEHLSSDESKADDVLAAVSDLSDEDQALAMELVGLGQAHLFRGWAAGVDTEERKGMLGALRDCGDAYPGGIAAYIRNARRFLGESASGLNPLDGYTPEVPAGVDLVTAKHGSEQVVALENAGLDVVKDCAFVLVAGGLGERLGYHGIKVALPTTLASKVCYLQMYIEQILALQAASNARAGNSDAAGTTRRIPLAIMTSDDTHAATVALLEANNYFGMQKGQVTLMKQEKVPALVDNHATIAMDGKYSVVTKPHGHGDVHTLLAGHGIAKQWAAEGRKYVTFFQDTNAACFDFLPRSLGVAVSQKYEVLSMCIPRKAGEAVGAITRLRRSDGSSITTCVEYNQLAPLLIATTNPDGDVNDPATGFSPFPGNLNQLIFAIQPYAAVLERTGGLVPEFVNPKYADEARSRFTKPTRLECMMQDHPKVLGPDARVGFVSLPVQSFSPVKNSIEGGQGKAKAGLRPQCALSGEMDVYGLAGERLAELGVRIEAPKPFTACGITVDRPAGVVLNARIGASHAALSAAFPTPSAVSVTQRSFLVIRGGGDVTIHSLTLDGTLVIEAAEGEHAHIRDLTVTNAGWDFQALAEDEAGVDDSLRIRGYRLVMAEDRRIVFDAEGRHDHTVTHHPREVLSGKAAVPAADSS